MSGGHRIHGLSGDEIAPDWAPLTPDDARAILARFRRFAGDCTIVWHSPRPFSSAARVLTRGGEIFIKRHDTRVRSVATLGEEHAFIAHLAARGLPVPEIHRDDSGASAFVLGAWTCEVHAPAAGVDLYRDAISWSPLIDLAQAREAGRMLAKLHIAARDYAAPQRSTHVLVARDEILRSNDLLAAIENACIERPVLGDYLHPRPWREELAPLAARHADCVELLRDEAPLWTHNDWHVSNLFWTDAGSSARICTVLDFGLAARSFALYDLATAIERNAIAWMELERGAAAWHASTARALLDGYAEILPLAPGARAAVARILPLVHIDFALSEIDYYHGIMQSRARADIAFDDFLVGHAAACDSAAGRSFLDAIMA